MKTISFFSVFMLIFLAACSKHDHSTNGSEVTICYYDDVSKNETLALSSLVENCTLIHFDDADEALFKPWFTTVTDKYIGIRQEGGPYKLFDISGKFIGDIGRVGQGPGEYSGTSYDDLIDEKNERIYIASNYGSKIFVFDTSGKFIKNIVTPQMLHKPKMHLSEDGTLTVVHMAFTGEKAMIIQFDAAGNVINQIEPPVRFLVESYDGEIFNTRNTPAFDFLHTSSDTLYHFNLKSNQIEPVFTVSINSSDKPFRQYFETKDYYFTSVWSKGRTLMTDKKTNISSIVKIRNDYFGNMDAPCNILTFRNGWFALNLEPGQLIDRIENRLKESDCSKEDKQKLDALLGSLDDNSNNVIFIGKLKK